MKPRLSLKARALQWLAQREHSRLELRRKLLVHAAEQAAAQTAEEAAEEAAGYATSAAPAASPALAPVAAPFSRRLPPSAEVQAGVDELLDWLVAGGHLSEARFVEGRVRVRAARHGKLRIRQELAQHRLALSPAEEQALDQTELARARQVWARKFGAPAVDASGRARQMRFLAARGFAGEVIRRVVEGDPDSA